MLEGDEATSPGNGEGGALSVEDRVEAIGITGHETAIWTGLWAFCAHHGGDMRLNLYPSLLVARSREL